MKIDLSKEWLNASYDDLKMIDRIINMADLSHMIAFHSQQSVEKSFKALIEHKKLRVPRQHDLIALKEFIKNDIAIENDNILDTLNQLYIESRYPGDMGLLPHGKPSLDDAKAFYDFARSVFDQICKISKVDKESFF
jgi:HEPN domain-containing protein